jgi:uncharacterized protein YbjT (DUF2867 family)
MRNNGERVLLTGATGYVGGRLLSALEREGVPVRCLARRPEYLAPRVGPSTEVVRGDVLDPPSLGPALEGTETAYYLVHSMGSQGSFEEADRHAAEAFGQAARAAGVKRIIYLGGLGRGARLSPHLSSRQEVGRILADSGVPTVELRASIIIGSGSLSFELIRALVQKLPVMVAPRWVRLPAQPIAIEDILGYLLEARRPDLPAGTYEIGGADRVSYLDLMKEYARQRGLRRLMITVPVLTPRLSSLWLGLVTPVYAHVGRKLIDSVRQETVVTNPEAAKTFSIRPRDHRKAIERALRNEDRDLAETRWSDALSSRGASKSWGGQKFGTRLVDSRSIRLEVEPECAFRWVRRVGGKNGWFFGDWLWRLRGFLDLLVGGAGMRRGRRHPEELAPGDTVDFWRVEALEPHRRLRLSAEMKVPGRAWLQFEVEPAGDGCVLRQTAEFDPLGLFGLAYWYTLYPIHKVVFSGMLRNLARAITSGRKSDSSHQRKERDGSMESDHGP